MCNEVNVVKRGAFNCLLNRYARKKQSSTAYRREINNSTTYDTFYKHKCAMTTFGQLTYNKVKMKGNLLILKEQASGNDEKMLCTN